MTVNNATLKDVNRFYKERPGNTIRAKVFKIDGVPVGVTGVVRVPEGLVMFSDITEELKPYLKTLPVLRTIKAMQKIAKDSRLPMYAIIDDLYGADLIKRMGFEHLHKDIYVCLD